MAIFLDLPTNKAGDGQTFQIKCTNDKEFLLEKRKFHFLMYDIFPNIGRETWSGHHSTKSKKSKAAEDRSKINWPLYG